MVDILSEILAAPNVLTQNFTPAVITGMSGNSHASLGIRKTTLTLASMAVPVTYDVAGGYAGLLLGAFPMTGAFGSPNLVRYGSRASLVTVTGDAEIAAAAAFRFALGTTRQITANAGELASNTFNILGATGLDNITLSSRTASNQSLSGSGSLVPIVGTTPRDLFLNIAGMEHTTTVNGVITLTGELVISWGVT